MTVDLGADQCPFESARVVCRVRPAAEEVCRCVTINLKIEGEKNLPPGNQARQNLSETPCQLVGS